VGEAPFAAPAFNLSATPATLARPPAPAPDAADAFATMHRRPPRSSPVGWRDSASSITGVGSRRPEIGYLLAELGAEVVKIESRANVDFLRRVTVEPGAFNRSWTFKRRVARPAERLPRSPHERGRELALDLCAAADVIIENNRGGVAARWGLDYEPIRRRRPDVVYYASQAFGMGGPLGRSVRVRPAQLGLRRHHLALEPPRRRLSRRLRPQPSRPHRSEARRRHHPGSVGAPRRTGEGQLIEMSQAEAPPT
jgi:hypothetical protein